MLLKCDALADRGQRRGGGRPHFFAKEAVLGVKLAEPLRQQCILQCEQVDLPLLLGHHGAGELVGRRTLDGFSYGMMRSAAAYLTLVDPAFAAGK